MGLPTVEAPGAYRKAISVLNRPVSAADAKRRWLFSSSSSRHRCSNSEHVMRSPAQRQFSICRSFQRALRAQAMRLQLLGRQFQRRRQLCWRRLRRRLRRTGSYRLWGLHHPHLGEPRLGSASSAAGPGARMGARSACSSSIRRSHAVRHVRAWRCRGCRQKRLRQRRRQQHQQQRRRRRRARRTSRGPTWSIPTTLMQLMTAELLMVSDRLAAHRVPNVG